MLLSQQEPSLIEHLDCYRFDSWKLPVEAKQSSLMKLTNTEQLQTVTFKFVRINCIEADVMFFIVQAISSNWK